MKTTLLNCCYGLLLWSVCTFASALELPTPRASHMVAGGNAVKIAVQEWGNPAGQPIVLIHAWSQSHWGWLPQLQSTTLSERYHLITMDLRGHGNSEKPLDKAQYNNADVWADDLHAVLEHLKLQQVTLVGWSYGGIVIADYLKKYGQARVAAVNFSGSLSGLGVERVKPYFGADIGTIMPAMKPELPGQALAMLEIARTMMPEGLDKELYGFLIATNMVVPPLVRQTILERQIDHKATYQSLQIPVLITHGDQDSLVLPIAAEEGVAFLANGKLSIHAGANHGPQWQDPARFNRELAALVDAATQSEKMTR